MPVLASQPRPELPPHRRTEVGGVALHGAFLHPLAGVARAGLIADDALAFGHGAQIADQLLQKSGGLFAPEPGSVGLIVRAAIAPHFQLLRVSLAPPAHLFADGLQLHSQDEVGVGIGVQEPLQFGLDLGDLEGRSSGLLGLAPF